MTNNIRIKRSTSTATPSSLQFGELAYSQIGQTFYVGRSDGTPEAIGGIGAFASLTSPAFTGTPTAPTAVTGNNSTQLATTAFVQAAVTAILQAKDVKDSCLVAPTTNINISAPGATIDGVTPLTDDRIFLYAQTAQATNGIYLYKGASTPMVRSTDADTSTKVTSGMVVTVEKGTNADTAWFLSTDDPITLGTTNLVFVAYPGGGGLVPGTALQKSVNTFNVLFDGVTIYANGSNQLAVKSSATANQVLLSQGSGSAAYGALPLGNSNAVTGTLAVTNGGLGRNTGITGLVKGDGTSYSAAVLDTDYIGPSSVIDGGTF